MSRDNHSAFKAATTLMIQGCTSDAGKSTLVTALCRLLARRGVLVAPFKPQNMALNSAVTEDGGEIGRAQAVQAAACRIPAHTDHNPVLLKPTADCTAQVIIQGRAIGNLSALDYHAYKQTAKTAVFDSWRRLAKQYQAVVVEGAGSPAEVNLRANDIANMGFAEEVDCPVWLVADIDRGGVFAHIVGTLACLSESEQKRIRGFIINRFRGDLALLQPGLDWLEEKTSKPVLAVLPYLHGLEIAAEDAVRQPERNTESTKASAKPSPQDHPNSGRTSSIPTPPALSRAKPTRWGVRGSLAAQESAPFRVIVPALPHISNHSDFDPFLRLDGVDFRFIGPNQSIPPADLIILPGSKNTRGDLEALRAWGWDAAIRKHLRYGGKLVGICGGYQMLGETIEDPHGIEGATGATPGLGLLPLTTTMAVQKKLVNVQGTLTLLGQSAPLAGYEIHHGETAISACAPLRLNGKPDGFLSDDGQILGSYLHGLFDEPAALNLILDWAGATSRATQSTADTLDMAIDRLTDALEAALDFEKALAAGLPLETPCAP